MRSVEAATRDDAIAAAQEQFGSQVRVIGVRRVRSGGVLGFFATERYVAEVADRRTRPAMSSSPLSSSPLSSATPATAASVAGAAAGPAAVARAAAPARNGAAAWADAAGGRPATTTDATPVRRSRVEEPLVDQARVNELIGLLAAQDAPLPTPVRDRPTYPKATFRPVAQEPAGSARPPRAPAGSTPTTPPDVSTGQPVRSAAGSSAPAEPSPFTAALARMIAGDRDVRQAVENAFVQPAAAPWGAVTEPRPTLAEALGLSNTAGTSRTGPEHEETVGEPVIAPPAIHPDPIEVPSWAPAEAPEAADTSREEAIAEVLRSALAQGHSDETLARILRRVLAGVSPQTALDDPAAPSEPASAVVPDAVLPDVLPALTESGLAAAPAFFLERSAEYDVGAEIAEEQLDAVMEAPLLARTASDPAPLGTDATTVMPPLSLLPPRPSGRGRGRPPVPPSSRPGSSSRPGPSSRPTALSRSTAASTHAAQAPAVITSLATVTRLPVVVRPDSAQSAVVKSSAPRGMADVTAQLDAIGVPAELLGTSFADDAGEQGAYSALTRALGLRLPAAPELPTGPGEIMFVVGPGVQTLRAAQSLAASLRLDPNRVQWASRGALASLAPQSSRVNTIDIAIDRRAEALTAGTVTIVAVDAPMRSDAYWMSQMLAIWAPAAVWAVVEATRKPDDVEPWLDGLARVDALMVQDTDLSADPAAVLRRVHTPVALLDGVRATPHRWASLICERLENARS